MGDLTHLEINRYEIQLLDLKFIPYLLHRKEAAEMFERFTDSARQVIVQAEEEAKSRNRACIGTEDLLLGAAYMESVAGATPPILASLGITREAIYEVLKEKPKQQTGGNSEGSSVRKDHLPFTDESKQVCETAVREAISLGHNFVGVGHIVLAIVRENRGLAAEVLKELEVDPEAVRDRIVDSFANPYDSIRVLEDSLAAAKSQIPLLRVNTDQDDVLKKATVNALEDHIKEAQNRLNRLKSLSSK